MTAPSGATLRTSAPLARDGPLQGARRALEDIGADLRYAVRTWLRQPGFVLVAVLSLACGIGLNTAVFSIINAIFLQGIRGVPAADRVVSFGERLPFTTFRDLRDTVTTLDGIATWQPVGVDLRVQGVMMRAVVPAVSDNYFATLGVRPLRGRFFTPAAARVPVPANEVVLDYEFWMKTLGGDPAVVGTDDRRQSRARDDPGYRAARVPRLRAGAAAAVDGDGDAARRARHRGALGRPGRVRMAGVRPAQRQAVPSGG